MTAARLFVDLPQAARAWRSCPAAERALFLEAWLLILWYWLRWRTGFYADLLRQGVSAPATPPDPAQVRPQAERLLAAFRKATHNHVVRASCAPRSLALQRLLQRRGWPAHLHLGIRRSEGGIVGHAWVESDYLPPDDSGGLAARFVVCRQQTGVL